MGMGTLATVGALRPKNLSMSSSTMKCYSSANQPTISNVVQLEKRAAGYGGLNGSWTVKISYEFKDMLKNDGPVCCSSKVNSCPKMPDRIALEPPAISPFQNCH